MGGNLHLFRGKLKTAQNTPSRKVKISKLKSGKSHIRTFNTQAYCLTIKGMYLTTSVNNTFTVVLLVLLCHFPHKMCLIIYLQPSDLGDRQSKFL